MTPPAVTYDDQTKIWRAFNHPNPEFFKQTLGEAFLKNVQATDPGKVLEFYYDTGLQKTMKEIYAETVTVAVNMQKMGLRQGDIVMLYSMVHPKVSAISLASFLLGLAVNPFETEFDRENMEYGIQLIDPTVLLYENVFKDSLEQVLRKRPLPNLKHFLTIDGQGAQSVDEILFKPISQAEFEAFAPPYLGDPQQLVAVYMLTSGSTGVPKGVAISHALLLNGFGTFWSDSERKAKLTPDAVVFSFSPLRWITQIDLMLQSLVMGVKRICVTGLPNGPYGCDIIRQGRITHFFSPPSVFKDILTAVPAGDTKCLSSLRAIWLGGETPSDEVIRLSAILAPKARAYRVYGMTELAGLISSDLVVNGGHLVPGHEVMVLDDNLQRVGPNVRGQLCLKTPVPYLGYYKIDNSTSFYENGFFNTGDYGFMDDNHMMNLIGRFKELVRTKDVILVPTEVESLVVSLPEVISAVLVGFRTSPSDTEDRGALFVIIDEKSSRDVTVANIKNLLAAKLRPEENRIITIVNVMEKYPITSCGKVNKPTLVKLAKAQTS